MNQDELKAQLSDFVNRTILKRSEAIALARAAQASLKETIGVEVKARVAKDRAAERAELALAQCKENEQLAAQAEQQMLSANTRLAVARQALEDVSTKERELSALLRAEEARAAQVSAQLTHLAAPPVDTGAALAAANNTSAAIRADVARAQSELATLNAQRDGLAQERAEIDTKLKRAVDDLGAQRQAQAKAELELERGKTATRAAEQATQAAQVAATLVAAQADDTATLQARERIEQSRAELQALLTKETEMAAQLRQVKDTLTNYKTEAEALEAKKREVVGMQKKLAQTQSIRTLQQSEAEQIKADLDRADNEVREMRSLRQRLAAEKEALTISLPILEREVGSAQDTRVRLNQQIERLKKEETALRGQLKQSAASAPASSQWMDDPRSQTTGNFSNAFANTQPEAPSENKSLGMTARLQTLGLTKPDAMARVVEGRVGTEAGKIQELERQLELAIRARLTAEARLKTEGKALQKVEEDIERSARAATLLQKELERERSATISREQELASLRERARTLLADLEGARSTLPAMQQDHEAAQAELAAMRLKLADALDAAATTRDQLRAQMDNREAVEKTLREAHTSNTQFTAEHAALLEGGAAARVSLAAARTEHAELSASHANAVAELAQLRNALTDAIAEATEARDALAAQKSIQETAASERAALLAQDAQAAEIFRSEETERERARTERMRIEAEREAQSHAELARLAVAVRTASDTIAIHERELSELETQQRLHRAAILERQKTTQAELDAHQATVAEHRAALTAQQESLHAAEREKSDIAVQLAQLAASNSSADSALKLAMNARTRREQDVQRLADENAQLAQSLRATQLNLEAERFRLRALHADAQTLAAQERHEAHGRAREERIGRAHQRAQAITAVARDRASDARYRLQAEQEVAALRATLLQLDEQTRGHAERRVHSERQLASERETVTRLAAAQHEAQQEINLRMEALAALNEERQLLTHEKQTLSEQCEQLAATVRTHESEAQRLREASTQANAQQAHADTHRLAEQALGDVLHQHRAELADLHAQRQVVDEQLRQARLAHAHACADQGQQIAQQQARRAELTALLNTSEAQAAHAATLFAAFEEEQSARKTVQTLAQQQVQRELAQVEQTLRTARHSLREVRVDAKREAATRSTEVRQLAEQATQSRVAHAQARATARALFARLQHEQENVHTLSAQVATHSTQHESLAQQIKQLREAVENANTQMVAQQAVASELGAQAAQARDQVEAQRALQRSLRDQTRQLESANRQAQEEIARLELSARTAQSDLEQAQTHEQHVRGELRALQAQHAQIQDELNTQRSALSATQANMSGVAQQIALQTALAATQHQTELTDSAESATHAAQAALQVTQGRLNDLQAAHQAVLDQARQAEQTLALAQHTAAQEQQQHSLVLAQLTTETQASRTRLLAEEAAMRADLDTQHRAHEARVSEHAAQRATLAQARQDAELLATTSVKELALLEANTRDAQQRLSAQTEQLREANSALARSEAAVKDSHDALRRSKQLAAQRTQKSTREIDEEPRQAGFFGFVPRWGWLAGGAAALGIAATGVYVTNTAETPAPAAPPVAAIAPKSNPPSAPIAAALPAEPAVPAGPMTWNADGTQSQKHGLHFAVTLALRAAPTAEPK